MTASCLACADGVTPEDYCQDHPKTVGCDRFVAIPPFVMVVAVVLVLALILIAMIRST